MLETEKKTKKQTKQKRYRMMIGKDEEQYKLGVLGLTRVRSAESFLECEQRYRSPLRTISRVLATLRNLQKSPAAS